MMQTALPPLPSLSFRNLTHAEFESMLGIMMRTGHFDSESLAVRSSGLYPAYEVFSIHTHTRTYITHTHAHTYAHSHTHTHTHTSTYTMPGAKDRNFTSFRLQ
jgi:hypothetical protein